MVKEPHDVESIGYDHRVWKIFLHDRSVGFRQIHHRSLGFAGNSRPFTLGANADTRIDTAFLPNDAGSAIAPMDADIRCTGTRKVCILQESNMIAQISIAEDRGAVRANITATAHRCNGKVDHFHQPPIMHQVNGGRPF